MRNYSRSFDLPHEFRAAIECPLCGHLVRNFRLDENDIRIPVCWCGTWMNIVFDE